MTPDIFTKHDEPLRFPDLRMSIDEILPGLLWVGAMPLPGQSFCAYGEKPAVYVLRNEVPTPSFEDVEEIVHVKLVDNPAEQQDAPILRGATLEQLRALAEEIAGRIRAKRPTVVLCAWGFNRSAFLAAWSMVLAGTHEPQAAIDHITAERGDHPVEGWGPVLNNQNFRRIVLDAGPPALFTIPRREVGVIFGLPFEYMLHTLPSFEQPPRIGDIGGHCGSFVIYALNRWQNGHVTTYEPHPESFKLLQSNVRGLRATAHNLAVVPHPPKGKMRLYEGKPGFGRHACSLRTDVVWDAQGAAPHNDQDMTRWVDVDTVDAAELPAFDILKVDHEGGEDETLLRYGDKLRGMRLLMVECHATGGDLDGAIRKVREIAIGSGMRYIDIHGTVVRFIRQ